MSYPMEGNHQVVPEGGFQLTGVLIEERSETYETYTRYFNEMPDCKPRFSLTY